VQGDISAYRLDFLNSETVLKWTEVALGRVALASSLCLAHDIRFASDGDDASAVERLLTAFQA
jgi:hypothetical protein